MGTALQQLPSQRRQQEQAHPEPTGQQLPGRSAYQQPTADEQYASSGNQARSELAGAQLAETPQDRPTAALIAQMDSPMAPYRAQVDAERPEDLPFIDGFLQTDDMFGLWAQGCATGLAQLEEEAHRWYFFGQLPPDYEAGTRAYKVDMDAYARMALKARALGPQVEATRALASHALTESDALRLMMVEQGLGSLEDGQLVLDAARVQQDEDTVLERFAASATRFEGRGAEEELATAPAAQLGDLGVSLAEMNSVIAELRALAAARTADASKAELDEIEGFIQDCVLVTDLAAKGLAFFGGATELAVGLGAGRSAWSTLAAW